MASSEERMKVLKMVQDGKITPEMASELLKALESSTRKPQSEETSGGGFSGKGGGRFFRVRVTDTDSGKTRVNVRLPLGMVNAGIRMGMRFSPKLKGWILPAWPKHWQPVKPVRSWIFMMTRMAST